MNDSKMTDSGTELKSKSYKTITKYFDQYFYKTDNFSLIKLIAYTPLGITLAFLRCIILTILITWLNFFPQLKNNPHFIRAVCWSLGLFAQSEDSAENTSLNKEPNSARIYVANHITCLDYLAIKSIVNKANYIEDENMNRNISTKYASHNQISTCFKNILEFQQPKNDSEDLYSQQRLFPFIFFPELIGTNGTHGVLKFDEKPFSLNRSDMQVSVVPVGLKAWRPVMSISVNWLGSNDLINIFFMLFTPLTIFKVTFFPEQLLKENETSEQFADRVQKTIASGLDLVCSNIDRESIRQMWSDYERNIQEQEERERNSEEQRRRQVTQNRRDVNFADASRVTLQVQNVLPHISYETVREHMSMTSSNDVDTILTSILDAGVSLEEQTESLSTVKVAVREASANQPVLKTPEKGKFISYETRKFNLLNDARKRYLAKNL